MTALSYYTVDEVSAALDSVVASYPTLARVIDLPFTSAEGRESRALHLSTSFGDAAGRDALMFIAGVHGAEWGSCEIVLNLAFDILEAYSLPSGLGYGGKSFSMQEVQDLLDQRDIVIFPLVNPDGRHFSQTARGRSQWRKNLNQAHARGDFELAGVDINRNFDFLFDLTAFAPDAGVVASDDPAKKHHYHGTQAFSEPESRNVRWLLDEFPRTGWFVDVHCTGESIQYVWSNDESQQSTPGMNFRSPAFDGLRGKPGDTYREFLAAGDLATLQRLAQRFVAEVQAAGGPQYLAGPTYELSPYSGTSHDYAYSRHLCDSNLGKVLGFVVEWGSWDCQPDWPQMQTIIRQVTAGLIGFGLETI